MLLHGRHRIIYAVDTPIRRPPSVPAKQKSETVALGVRVVRHGCSVTFQVAEVMVPRNLFAHVLVLIA